jgi:hypothetical protein
MKYVRSLVHMEDEIQTWLDILRERIVKAQTPMERLAFEERYDELTVYKGRVHQLADDFAHMPFRMRELQMRALDPYR